MSSDPTSSAPESAELPPPREEGRCDWRQVALGSLIILLAVFAVYWPALRGEFLWDDLLVVHRNPLVTGERSLGSIWFRADFPLATTAFWLQWLAWGNHPMGYHVVNVLLHAAGAVLLWRVLMRLRIPAAWLAAMIFAVHPVCVASVAWISELKNTLSLPFYLLSLLWYLQLDSETRPSSLVPRPSPRYWLSLLAFVLALLSKTSTVMLPVVLLGCAWWQRGRIGRKDWLRMIPFLALALGFGLMSIGFQARGAMGGVAGQSGSWWGRLAGAGMALWFYLSKALLPLHLNMIYPRWEIEAAAAWSYLPLLLWGGMLAACWGLGRVVSGWPWANEPQRREERREESEGGSAQTNRLSETESQVTETGPPLRSSRLCGSTGYSSHQSIRFSPNWGRHLLFGLGCFTVTLFPVLGFFDMYYLTLSRVSDHFAYLPLTAVVALVAAGLARILDRAHRTPVAADGPSANPVQRTMPGVTSMALAFVGGGLVVGLAALTFLRVHVFVSEEALWRDTLAKNPAAWCAHANLGWILASQQKYDEARQHLVESLKVNPKNAQAHSNLGRVLATQGQFAEADVEFVEAVKIKPKDAEIRRSYATVLADQGKNEEAVKQLRELLQLKPDVEARSELASLLYQTAKFGEAVAEYRQVVAVKPDQPEVLSNLAWLLATSPDSAVRNGADAVRFAEQCCRLTSYQRAPMLGALAAAYAEGGRFPEAAATAQKAIDLARAGGDARFAAVNEQLLRLYRAGKPYHMPPATAARPGTQ